MHNLLFIYIYYDLIQLNNVEYECKFDSDYTQQLITYRLIKSLLVSFFIILPFLFFSQWRNMSRFDQYGVVNYVYQVGGTNRLKDAQRIILETIADNQIFDADKIKFNKGKVLLLNEAVVDPLNSNFVYVIHAINSSQDNQLVINLLFYYMENRLRYFYELNNQDEHVFVTYDPAFNTIIKK